MADSSPHGDSPHDCEWKGTSAGGRVAWRRRNYISLVLLAENCEVVDLVVLCEKIDFVLIWLVESCKTVDMWQASSL